MVGSELPDRLIYNLTSLTKAVVCVRVVRPDQMLNFTRQKVYTRRGLTKGTQWFLIFCSADLFGDICVKEQCSTFGSLNSPLRSDVGLRHYTWEYQSLRLVTAHPLLFREAPAPLGARWRGSRVTTPSASGV